MTPRLLLAAAVAGAAFALPAPSSACTPETCPPNPLCAIKAVWVLGICPPWS